MAELWRMRSMEVRLASRSSIVTVRPVLRVEGDLIVNATTATALGLRVIVPDRPGMGHSDYQPDRRIVDWPDDVLDLAKALGLERFAVLGSSGGAPYAAVCGARIPDRVRAVGLLGGIAPPDAPGVLASMSGPLRMMFRLARFAPAVLRGLYRHGEHDRNVPVTSGRYLASVIPRCRATFYPNDAHLSVPLNHQEEIFGALAAAATAA